MLLAYAVVAVPKQGSIKVVNMDDESEVISERATKRTEVNKVEIANY